MLTDNRSERTAEPANHERIVLFYDISKTAQLTEQSDRHLDPISQRGIACPCTLSRSLANRAQEVLQSVCTALLAHQRQHVAQHRRVRLGEDVFGFTRKLVDMRRF